MRNRHHAGCRVAVERAADRYTLICDGARKHAVGSAGRATSIRSARRVNRAGSRDDTMSPSVVNLRVGNQFIRHPRQARLRLVIRKDNNGSGLLENWTARNIIARPSAFCFALGRD